MPKLPHMHVTVRRWEGYTDGDILGEMNRAADAVLENPYTDMGEAQAQESMEQSGQFMPGTVKVQVGDDGALLVEGVLKGVIHEVSMDMDVVF